MSERTKIFELLRKKRTICKTCSSIIVRMGDEIAALWVASPEEQSSIFHVVCSSCTNKRRGQLFVCIFCGQINSRRDKMIKNNGCKCADGPVFSVLEFSDCSFAVDSG